MPPNSDLNWVKTLKHSRGAMAGQRRFGPSLRSVKSLTALRLREERGYLSSEAMGTQRQLDSGETGRFGIGEYEKRGSYLITGNAVVYLSYL